MNAYLACYRAVLHVLPAHFRSRYGDEMMEVAGERIAEGGVASMVMESGSVLIAAVRLHARAPQLHLATTLIMSLMVMMLRGNGPPVPDFEVTASDPAGEFTLVVRGGRAIGGTIDHQPLAPEQLVHAGDSIRVLAHSGAVLFAVAYDAANSTIAWEPRPAACRGRAFDCGAY